MLVTTPIPKATSTFPYRSHSLFSRMSFSILSLTASAPVSNAASYNLGRSAGAVYRASFGAGSGFLITEVTGECS